MTEVIVSNDVPAWLDGPIYGARHDGFYRVGPLTNAAQVRDQLHAQFTKLQPRKVGFISWESRAGSEWLLLNVEPSSKKPKQNPDSDEAILDDCKGKEKPSDANFMLKALMQVFKNDSRELSLVLY